jgi:HemY protein
VALKLVPDFVPAALIAARIQSNRGETRKAMSLLRRVWRATSHPHVAALYANAQPGASSVDRLKRIRELIDQPPPNLPAALVLARAAVDAYDWPAARNALANYSVNNPTQGVCLLMAEIEDGQNSDQGKAREWLARAVRAPRDPVWVADGITADDWEPVSPVTGALDAFEWRVPLAAVAGKAEPLPPVPASLPVPAETSLAPTPGAQ